MRDHYGREINYMRISVTDRCNLHCSFCMPKEKDKICFQKKENLLSYEEIMKAVDAVIPLGIHKFRITGGEPLVRDGIIDFIGDLKHHHGVEQVYLTTNGTLLGKHLDQLAKAGLDGINISLCSTMESEYANITGSHAMHTVMDRIYEAVGSGIHTKVNRVILPEADEKDLIQAALIARDHPIEVRFIEMMPIGCGSSFGLTSGIEVLATLTKVFGAPVEGIKVKGNGPAVYHRFPGFKGNIGFINAMSCSFCDRCNRIRLTADGWLKLCLNYDDGIDLRREIRSQIPEEELSAMIRNAILQKPRRHNFRDQEKEKHQKNTRIMAQIGG